MKFNKLLMVLVFTIMSALLLMLIMLISGCSMDVAEPIWERPYTNPPAAKITGVVPDQALAGVGIITINGENFADQQGINLVFFDNFEAEVLSSSTTSIVVRRPNIVSDTAVIKVSSNQTLLAAKHSPYKVVSVTESYGNFEQNAVLSVLAADQQENLYVVEATTIRKITPDTRNTIFTTANRASFDANVGPDGFLYLTGNNRSIDKVNLTTGEVSRWVQMPSGKNVKYGDFDDFGNFYTGGRRTDLLVVEPNGTPKAGAGHYTLDEILAIRCFNNFVYVATKTSSDTSVIYRSPIDANGNVGAKEVVLDMRTTPFADRIITGLTFSDNGVMYIATDAAADPILTFNIADGNVDYLYKGILRPYCKAFCWGSGNYIYMINGDAVAGEEWKVYRVDTGTSGTR